MLKVALLGPPQVSFGRDSVTSFRTAKAQALLYYLVETGMAHSRMTLGGVLWGNMPERDARKNLTKALSELRKIVGTRLRVGPQYISFEFNAGDELDLALLRAAVTAGVAADDTVLECAVDLVRGDFLQGFGVHNAPEFELWMVARRAELRQQVIDLFDCLAERHDARGDSRKAIGVARRRLALDAWSEEAHRRLMRLLAQDGQRGAALAQYEICRTILAEEMAVEPSSETESLAQAIRTGGVAPATPAVVAAEIPPSDTIQGLFHNLPRPRTPFVGRQAELERILGQLRDPACRLLTLAGPGGLGKTRLAVEAGWSLVKDAAAVSPWCDGVYFVPLDAVHSRAGIVAAIGVAMSQTPQAEAVSRERLVASLRNKRSLLLLDSFEHLYDQVDLLSELLTAAPGIKLMVTSRVGLCMQEEWFNRLTGLTVPPSARRVDVHAHRDTDVDALDYDAVQFFEQCARRARADFVGTLYLNEIVGICRLVEGMPLAIELAAGWLKALNPGQIEREITHSLDILASSNRSVVARHRSIRAVLDQTWVLLEPSERTVFQRMSVFGLDFDHGAAAAVAGASLPLLLGYAEKCLIRSDSSGRFHIHALIRQYAREQLQLNPQEEQATFERHCAYFAGYAAARFEDVDAGPRQLTVLNEVAVEWDNLTRAWAWAVAHRRADLIQPLGAVICAYCLYRGRSVEGAELLASGVDALQSLPAAETDTVVLAAQQTYFGWLALRHGQTRVAEAAFRQSYRLYALTKAPFPPSVATDPALGLGVVANTRGDYAEATRFGKEAHARALACGDKKNLQYACYVLANARYATGDYNAAYALAQQAYALSREVQQNYDMAYFLDHLGEIAVAMGRLGEAWQHYEGCLALQEKYGHPAGIADALNHLANVALLKEEHVEADALYQRALALHNETGDCGGAAASLVGLGNSANIQTRYDQALHWFHRALIMSEELDIAPLTLGMLLGAGETMLHLGHRAHAVDLLAPVLRHPASRQPLRDRARQLLSSQENFLNAQAGDAEVSVLAMEEENVYELSALKRRVLTIVEGILATQLQSEIP